MFSKRCCNSYAMCEVTCRFVGLACEPYLRLVLYLYISQRVSQIHCQNSKTGQNKAGLFGTADAATLGARVLKEYFQHSATPVCLNFSHFSNLTHFTVGAG